MMPKLWAFYAQWPFVVRVIYCAAVKLCRELVGECIQGLVLLGNQWLVFVELGGFANNALFYGSECLPVGQCPLANFVCALFCCLCEWNGVSKRNGAH